MCSCSLGSLLLQDMFLNLLVFAFQGQNKKFTVNLWLTCILYCDFGPFFYENSLQVQYVDSYHGYHICHRMFFFEDAVASLRESYTFLSDLQTFLCLVELMSFDVAFFAQLCWLFWVLPHITAKKMANPAFRETYWRPSTLYAFGQISPGLSCGQTFFRSQVSTLHVDLISCQ